MPKKRDKSQYRPDEESLRHQEAFEIYYAMGDARSLQLVSDIIGVGKNYVEGWSSAFQWQDRIAQRDQELIRRIQQDYQDEVLRYRVGYIELVKGMIKSCLEVDKDGNPTCNIKPTSVSDLEKLINLHMKLMGDAGGPLDGSKPSGEGGSGGGKSIVNIVLPQQIDMGQWQDMVKGGNQRQVITVPQQRED